MTVKTIPAPVPTTTTVTMNVNQDGVVKPRLKRVACTCPNCTEGERPADRKRQHICHIAGKHILLIEINISLLIYLL